MDLRLVVGNLALKSPVATKPSRNHQLRGNNQSRRLLDESSAWYGWNGMEGIGKNSDEAIVKKHQEELYIDQHIDMVHSAFAFHGTMHITSKREIEVSFIPFTKEIDPLDIFNFLYDFADDFTLKIYTVIECSRCSYVVAERVCQADFFFWVKFDELKKDSKERDNDDQHEIICIFVTFLRSIIRGFILLIKNEKFIEDFQGCTFVTTSRT